MSEKKWFISNKKADFNAISKKFGISPVVARCIINRGVEEQDIKKYLFGKRTDMYSPTLLMNADLAATKLKEYIKQKKKIRVIGDYDVDGVTATQILTTGLERCGANVDYSIPHRIEDGYGLNETLIEKAHEAGIEVIVTCDNGIAAKDAIDVANSLGMNVIVTDHHEVPYMEDENGVRTHIIPNAVAVVDPKQPNDTYPFKGICGAVVAYKVIELLYSKSRVPKKELDYLLQFAALGTVCDVMDLCDENRIIVREGLRIINETPCVGIKALIEATGLGDKAITAGHFGFVLGPCINASGRLDTATKAVQLLKEKEPDIALTMANLLKETNDKRKKMTEDKVLEAVEMIEGSALKDDMVLVVKLEDCHESIAGIIAGRLREKYNKPALVFTDAEKGIKGSGRSIETYNMFEELNKFKYLFTKFGGHAMAAGLSLENIDKLNEFRVEINKVCTLTQEDLVEVTHIDVELPLEYASVSLCHDIELLEPFGVANPKPIFAIRNLSITRALEMGAKHNAMKYHVMSEKGTRSIVYDFGNIDDYIDHLKEKYGEDVMEKLEKANAPEIKETIAFQVSLNNYQGNESAQLVMCNYK